MLHFKMISVVALGLLIPSIHGYNYKDANLIYIRGMPVEGSCTPNNDGSATWKTFFTVKSKGSQPDGDDGVVLSIGCANNMQIQMGKDWYNCKNPSAGMSGGAAGGIAFMNCGLADDVSQYGGSLTCPNTNCSNTKPFSIMAVDKNQTTMNVIGSLFAPNLEGNCMTGGNSVNVIQMNNDFFCWNSAGRTTRSVGIMVLVDCKRASTVLPTVTITWSHPLNISEGSATARTHGNTLTFDVPKGSVGTGGILTGGGAPCQSQQNGPGIEVAGKELRMLSCNATVNNQNVPCAINIDNIGGNTKYYQWIATGPDPFLVTA